MYVQDVRFLGKRGVWRPAWLLNTTFSSSQWVTTVYSVVAILTSVDNGCDILYTFFFLSPSYDGDTVLTGFADRLVCPASATGVGGVPLHTDRVTEGSHFGWTRKTKPGMGMGRGRAGVGLNPTGVVSQDRCYFFYPSSFILKYTIVDICATCGNSEARCRQPNDIIPGDYKLPSFEKTTTTTTACKCMWGYSRAGI